MPGFGGSTADARAERFEGRADAVLELADHLGLARFAVLGHSMGGGTALVLGATRPDRVSHVAVVSSVALRPHRALGLPPQSFGALALAMRAPLLGHAMLPIARAQYRKRNFAGAETMTRDDFARQMRMIAATDFGLLRRIAGGPLPPTLVAYAEDDRLVQTSVSEELAGAIPAATVLPFATGGHNLQKTRAPELAAALRKLMASA